MQTRHPEQAAIISIDADVRHGPLAPARVSVRVRVVQCCGHQTPIAFSRRIEAVTR